MAALSHICPHCGWDLARTRAPVESAYGLRVAVCPRCRQASVRRPVGQTSLRFFRAVDAASGLILSLIVTGSLLLWSAGVVTGLAQAMLDADAHILWLTRLRDEASSTGWDMERVRFTLAIVAIGLASGAWLTSALAHWRLWRLAPLWLALVFAGACAAEIAWALRWLLAQALGRSLPYAGADPPEWIRRVELTLALGLVMLAGAPMGVAIRWIEAKARAGLLRWRRRRLRKERSGA